MMLVASTVQERFRKSRYETPKSRLAKNSSTSTDQRLGTQPLPLDHLDHHLVKLTSSPMDRRNETRLRPSKRRQPYSDRHVLTKLKKWRPWLMRLFTHVSLSCGTVYAFPQSYMGLLESQLGFNVALALAGLWFFATCKTFFPWFWVQ